MKSCNAFFLSCLLLGCCYVYAEDGLPEPPEGKKWVKIESLSDEFNATEEFMATGNKVDIRKWSLHHPYWDGRDSEYSVNNISIEDGKLLLRSTLREGATEINKDTVTTVVTAACLASSTPRAQHGFYQARFKCSDLSMTSSFWLQGFYSEIDICENFGRPTNPKSKKNAHLMKMNTHYYPNGWADKDGKNLDKATPADWEMPGLARDNYYVYGLWWKDENTVIFYHNGNKVKEIKTGGPFKEGMFLYFDTEVFKWHGYPTKESLLDPERNVMSVDWVRSWELVDK